jgi:hypothetical protein
MLKEVCENFSSDGAQEGNQLFFNTVTVNTLCYARKPCADFWDLMTFPF